MSLPCLIIKNYNEQYENSARDDSCYILKQEIRKTQTLDIPFSYFCSEVHTNIGNCICLEFSIWSYIKLFYFLLLRSTKESMFPTHILSSLLSATNLWSLEVLSEEIVFFKRYSEWASFWTPYPPQEDLHVLVLLCLRKKLDPVQGSLWLIILDFCSKIDLHNCFLTMT